MAKIIVVASGKGGVGKSTSVTGISLALQSDGKKVLAVDCDIGLNSLDTMLNVGKEVLFNWGDAIAGRYSAVEAVTETPSGVCLLRAPQKYDPSYTCAAFQALVDELSEGFDFVLLDAPAGIGSGLVLASSPADLALIVSTPDEISVRCGQTAADLLYGRGIPDIKLIINRFDTKAVQRDRLLNIDDAIDATSLRLIGIIPQDDKIWYSFSNGISLSQKSKSYKAMTRIAGRLEGKRIYLRID